MSESELLTLCWPDTHIASHHKDAVSRLISFIYAKQPEQVILLGDFIDCLSTARWTSDTIDENGAKMQQEIDQAKGVLAQLRDAYSGPVFWLPGNHEERLHKWGARRGKAVFGIEALTVPSLLEFKRYHIETPGGITLGEKPFEFLPGVVAVHGDRLGVKAGMSVQKMLDHFGLEKSVVMGHSHRLAVVYRAGLKKGVFGVESGHLMDRRKADYISYGTADWQMGFSVIERHRKLYVPKVVPMQDNGSFLYGGDLW